MRCHVCGRELKKSAGPIGPKCLQKLRNKIPRRRVNSWKQAAKYDIYGDLDGQKEDEPTSESTEGQETSPNGGCS